MPAAVRWEQATPDERWLAAPPEELVKWSMELNTGRFRMILEDLAELPAEPGIVVEGTPLLPWLAAPHLASPRQAVWLVPTPEFASARLRERLPLPGFVESSDPERAAENRIAREELFAEAIARSAAELDLATVRVGGSLDLDEATAAVEEQLAPALDRLSRVASRDVRTALRRDENRTVLRQLLLYARAHPASVRLEETVYDFACECGASGCEATLRLSVPEYERAAKPVVHSSHSVLT